MLISFLTLRTKYTLEAFATITDDTEKQWEVSKALPAQLSNALIVRALRAHNVQNISTVEALLPDDQWARSWAGLLQDLCQLDGENDEMSVSMSEQGYKMKVAAKESKAAEALTQCKVEEIDDTLHTEKHPDVALCTVESLQTFASDDYTTSHGQTKINVDAPMLMLVRDEIKHALYASFIRSFHDVKVGNGGKFVQINIFGNPPSLTLTRPEPNLALMLPGAVSMVPTNKDCYKTASFAGMDIFVSAGSHASLASDVVVPGWLVRIAAEHEVPNLKCVERKFELNISELYGVRACTEDYKIIVTMSALEPVDPKAMNEGVELIRPEVTSGHVLQEEGGKRSKGRGKGKARRAEVRNPFDFLGPKAAIKAGKEKRAAEEGAECEEGDDRSKKPRKTMSRNVAHLLA